MRGPGPARGRGRRSPPPLRALSPRQAAQGTPTLSLYLLEANLRALAEAPRPCFRSRMVTSWLAARGPRQGFGIRGVFLPPPRPALLAAPSLPGVRGPAVPWSDLLGKPLPIPPSGCPSPPAPDLQGEPEPLTRFFDGDGEAVVVGAALGLDGHVAGGVTCRRGARIRWGGRRAPSGSHRRTGAPLAAPEKGTQAPRWSDRSCRILVLCVRRAGGHCGPGTGD